MSATFYSCSNLVTPPITIPNSVTSMAGTFSQCSRLISGSTMTIGSGVTNMYGTFDGCSNLTGTITILSSGVSNFTDCFYQTSLPKTIRVPASSTTFTTINAIYGTGVNGVTITTY